MRPGTAHDIALDRSSRLRPSQAECSVCGLVFGGVSSFDLHRVGPVGARRCLSADELVALGLRQGPRGWGRPYNGPATLRVRPDRSAAA